MYRRPSQLGEWFSDSDKSSTPAIYLFIQTMDLMIHSGFNASTQGHNKPPSDGNVNPSIRRSYRYSVQVQRRTFDDVSRVSKVMMSVNLYGMDEAIHVAFYECSNVVIYMVHSSCASTSLERKRNMYLSSSHDSLLTWDHNSCSVNYTYCCFLDE